MPTYQAPLPDMRYLLNDVLEIGRYDNLPGLPRRAEILSMRFSKKGRV